jgi:hypothetical protein
VSQHLKQRRLQKRNEIQAEQARQQEERKKEMCSNSNNEMSYIVISLTPSHFGTWYIRVCELISSSSQMAMPSSLTCSYQFAVVVYHPALSLPS